MGRLRLDQPRRGRPTTLHATEKELATPYIKEEPRSLKNVVERLAQKTAKRIAWDLKPGIKLFTRDEISDDEHAYIRKISRGDNAREMLIEVAETHQNVAVRKAAVAQLGKLRGAISLEFFRKVLSEDAKAIPASAAVIRF